MTQAATLAQLASSGALSADTSGNVGIGTTSPSTYRGVSSGVYSQVLAIAPTGSQGTLAGEATYSGYGQSITAALNIYQNSANGYLRYLDIGVFGDANPGGAGSLIRFLTQTTGVSSLTERMRITESGGVLIGTTSFAAVGISLSSPSASGYYSTSAVTTANFHLRFANPNGAVGSITTTGSATAYATSSDYRLKENVQPMVGALDKISQLKPCTYTWKSDGSDGEGFIAHELQSVIPNAVIGEKDAVDADGNPNYQGVDTSFLVATLTAAIQELKAELDVCKAEIAALKGV